jgi:glycerol kinase
MQSSFILSIDQGTSSTKTIIFDEQGKAIARGSAPLQSYFSPGGFVEQDPEEIMQNVFTSVGLCLEDFKKKGGDLQHIKTCGISNQRETFVIWDEAGKPLNNAVVWQCKRSVEICERLKKEGLQDMIKQKTGLVIDPYFSGTKLMWLYENLDGLSEKINQGEVFFGTIDSWLLYRLSNGESYLTDFTNASRTLFFNLAELRWDKELLSQFNLTGLQLPEPKASASYFGETDFNGLLQNRIPITGMIGDSHAAAFGEGCFVPGTAKATLGTGSSIIMNIGSEAKESGQGMVTTICWSTEDRVDYALEGVIVSCGSTIEWLRNELGLFNKSTETEQLATSVSDNNASITGLTFDCNRNHVVRAALESIPFQINDVITAMEQDSNIDLKELMVDGGITANKFILQFLADLLGKTVVNIGMPDVSALGAAYLAGLKSGIYKDIDHLKTLNIDKTATSPQENRQMKKWHEGWNAAIKAGSMQNC